MNNTTLFLAQIMGPTLAAFGLGILLSPKYYLKLYKSLERESLALMLFTMVALSAGTALVVKHFLWGSLTEILISIVGLAMLVKGILFAVIPKTLINLTQPMTSTGLLRFGGTLWLLAGGYLCWVGFF